MHYELNADMKTATLKGFVQPIDLIQGKQVALRTLDGQLKSHIPSTEDRIVRFGVFGQSTLITRKQARDQKSTGSA